MFELSWFVTRHVKCVFLFWLERIAKFRWFLILCLNLLPQTAHRGRSIESSRMVGSEWTGGCLIVDSGWMAKCRFHSCMNAVAATSFWWWLDEFCCCSTNKNKSFCSQDTIAGWYSSIYECVACMGVLCISNNIYDPHHRHLHPHQHQNQQQRRSSSSCWWCVSLVC